MVSKIRMKIFIVMSLFSLIIISNEVSLTANIFEKESHFSLIALVPGYWSNWRETYDIAELAKIQLDRIGIDLDIRYYTEPCIWVGEIPPKPDFDLCFVTSYWDDDIQLADYFYGDNELFNYQCYNQTIDWEDELSMGVNQWYLDEFQYSSPSEPLTAINHFWDWQQYILEELCMIKPLYQNQELQVSWKNLKGYSFTDGLVQSWGKMFWNGIHQGQVSTDELVISVSRPWNNLNPLFQDDIQSEFFSRTILEPLLWIDSDRSVHPHLIESYNFIDNTTLELKCRKGIKWDNDPDGVFPNEYFDAEDVYFTIQAWKKVSNDKKYAFDWIESMDIIDKYTIRIHLDSNSDSPRDQPLIQCLEKLSILVLPEHFLNQTQLADGVTPDITDPSWNTFAVDTFGTGMFRISSHNFTIETILNLKEDYWGRNTTLTQDRNLDWINRFGGFVNPINQLKILYNPYVSDTSKILNGQIDIYKINKAYHYNCKNYNYLEILDNPNFNIHKNNGRTITYILYRLINRNTPLQSTELCPYDTTLTKGLAIRKAISYAINRNLIRETLGTEESKILNTPIPSRFGIWCHPDPVEYNYNLKLARYYLSLAGYGEYQPTHTIGYSFYTYFSFLIILPIIYEKIKKS